MAIRQLAHGFYSLIPILLTMFGWFAALFQDGCDYARVTGPIVGQIASQPNAPYLEAGRNAYREPYYNARSDSWETEYLGSCLEYPTGDTDNGDNGDSSDATALVEIDMYWSVSKGLDFASIVLGGTGTLFLWFSACCVFSRGTWRLAGFQVLLASLFQAASFLWFQTSLCTDTDANGNGNSCALFWGSKTDIVAAVFWFSAALAIFCHYPIPKAHLARLQQQFEGDGILDTTINTTNSQASVTETTQQPSIYNHQDHPNDNDNNEGQGSGSDAKEEDDNHFEWQPDGQSSGENSSEGLNDNNSNNNDNSGKTTPAEIV